MNEFLQPYLDKAIAHRVTPDNPLPGNVDDGAWRPWQEDEVIFSRLHVRDIGGKPYVPARLYGSEPSATRQEIEDLPEFSVDDTRLDVENVCGESVPIVEFDPQLFNRPITVFDITTGQNGE